MTLKYKLLNKPGNIEDFADELRKKGITEVEISGAVGRTGFYSFRGEGNPWYLTAKDKSGKLTYEEQLYFSRKFTIPSSELKMKVEICKVIIKGAKEWRGYLMRRGIGATIMIFEKGEPVPLTVKRERELKRREAIAERNIKELRKEEAELGDLPEIKF